jgi:protein-disulfide isomerase
MKQTVAILVLGAALLAFTGRTYAEEKPAAVSKSEIEQIVREYILRHPEVLVESVQAHQRRERMAAQQKSREAIAARRSELLEDAVSPVAGKADAPVTIVQFFDYRCAYCRRVAPTLAKLLEEQQNVRMIFRELPILGPESHMAASAALAAHRQGAYLNFHRELMRLNSPATPAVLEETAAKLGLNIARWKTDMNSPEIRTMLAQNQQLAAALGVKSTPSFVVGDELVSGALDRAGFQALIARAAGSTAGAPPAASASRNFSLAPR